MRSTVRGLHFNRILAGTALVLVMATTCGAQVNAQVRSRSAVEIGVPLPERAALPPPTMMDLSSQPLDSVTKPATDQAARSASPTPEISDSYTALDPADQPIVDKVRDLLTAKVDKIFASKKERSAVETFYQTHKGTLLWVEGGTVNARARAAMGHLKTAAAEGLDPNDYKAPNFDAAQSNDALAEAELKLTATVLTYARHLQAGRFPFARVGRDIEVPQLPPEPADVLAKIADAANVIQALEGFSPPQPAYKKLKQKLAELRGKSGGGAGEFADGSAQTGQGPDVGPARPTAARAACHGWRPDRRQVRCKGRGGAQKVSEKQ